MDPTPIGAAMMSGELGGISFGPDGSGWIQTNETDEETREVHQTLLRVRYGGAAADTFARVASPALTGLAPGSTVLAPAFPRLVFDAAPDGRIAVAGDSAEYEIRVMDPDGAVQSPADVRKA